RRFDRLGAALVTIARVAILIGFERVADGGPVAPAAIAAGFVALVLFGWHERRIEDPVLPIPLLVHPTIAGCVLTQMLTGFVQFAFLSYLPSLAVRVVHDINAGLVVVPLTVLSITLGAGSSLLALRSGTRLLGLAAGLSAGMAGLAVCRFGDMTGGLFVASLLGGLAVGLILIPTLLLAQHVAPPDRLGAVTSLVVYARNFGGAAGIAAVAAVVERVGADGVAAQPAHIDGFIAVTIVGFAIMAAALLLPSRATEADIVARSKERSEAEP
ncbi:MAG: MFS transporter, partial [Alphaproteobacteria bacterium]